MRLLTASFVAFVFIVSAQLYIHDLSSVNVVDQCMMISTVINTYHNACTSILILYLKKTNTPVEMQFNGLHAIINVSNRKAGDKHT